MIINKKLKSKVTTAPGHDFGLRAGNDYQVVGYPSNTNSGVVIVLDEISEQTVWAESYFET